MRYFISGMGLVGALVLMAASGSMNFMYWLTQGQSAREADILASVSVAFDILKSILPFCIAWAWASRKRGYVVVGSALFVLFFCFSLMSAIGFAAGNRSSVSGGREALAMRLETGMNELKRARTELGALPAHRTVAVIAEELKGMRKDHFWNGSQSCNDPSGWAAQNFCKKYAERQTEQAAADSAEKLSARIAELSREAEGLKAQGAGQGSDPQVMMVAVVSGLDKEMAKTAIVIFVSVLVELGAAFGLFLALGHSFNHVHGGGQGALPTAERGVAATPRPLLTEPDAEKPKGPARPLRLVFKKDGTLAVDEGEDA